MGGDGYVKFLVRIPGGLMDALKRLASENRRSVTGEIVYRLERSVRADEQREPPRNEARP